MIRPEAEWFLKRQDPLAPEATEGAFQQWVTARSSHGLGYAQCELMWDRVGELRKDDEVRTWLAALNEAAAVRPVRTPWFRIGIAAAAGIVLAIAGTLIYQSLRPPVYQTAIGEQRDVRLADGSRMTLNTGTRVVVRYGTGARRIELSRGEALFDVHPDATRPFEVSANAGLTRALGTQFAVEHTRAGITVSVLEGLVEVLREGSDARLAPAVERGQAVRVTADGALAYSGPANVKRIAAWQNRLVEFDGEPLESAIAEINRYSPRRFVLGRASLKDLPISGVFHTTALEGFTFALQETLGLRVIDNGKEWVVLAAET
jgi:transmembrane sensor